MPTVQDSLFEANEGFVVELSSPVGATIADGTGAGTITDDEEAPSVSIGDAEPVREGKVAEFAVTLSAASYKAVTVRYATADGTAVAGSDYESRSGRLEFAPGETRKRIAVPTVQDSVFEADEGFVVELSSPVGATLADETGAGTITDDDDPPGIAIDDAPPANEGDTTEFLVRLDAPSGEEVTVSYRTVDGTAVAEADYATTSGSLRFEPGQTTMTIPVATLRDDLFEWEETFAVELNDLRGATLVDGTGVGTIVDDDEPPALLIDDAPPVGEGATAQFAVRLSAPSGRVVTVSYRTVDGTAVAGADYATTAGSLRFEPGQTTLIIPVATLVDELVEGAERFTVELSEPVGATVADGTGEGTITDDPRRRMELVNRDILPEVGRALAFTAVACRIDRAFTGAATWDAAEKQADVVSLSRALTSGRSDGWTSLGRELPSLEEVLGDSTFLVAPQEEGDDGPGRFAAWGCGDYRHLAGGGDGGVVDWDGEVFSAHVGADVRLGSDGLAGLSVSRSKGLFDYTAAGRGAAGDELAGGRYEVRLTGVHPYLGWAASPDLDLWGTVGHAWGEVRILDGLTGVHTSPATLDSAAVGVSGRLLERGSTNLKLKAEGALARLRVAGDGAMFGAVTVDMRRLRVGAEASHEHVYSSGRSFTPWAELALRHDAGDGETGAGLEVGGGLRYQDPEGEWTTEGYGRWLALHEGTLREWGFGALIRFDPGASRRGPAVSLTPAWGDTASGVERLWEQGTVRRTRPAPRSPRLEARFGYGFSALRGRGIVTPFGAVSLTREPGRGYRFGGRLAVGRSITISLEADRRERTPAPAVHALMARGALRF